MTVMMVELDEWLDLHKAKKKHGTQAARIAALEATLRDLMTGAEQQSQSHVDVLVKCHAALDADD